ncbi:MAG: hypothetical protein K2Z25_21170 [Beijerinckiaceae bacterium]|nr:hypothetical protein [Beijerinckiaceae bacterium]
MTIKMSSVLVDRAAESQAEWVDGRAATGFDEARFKVCALTKQTYLIKRGKLFKRLSKNFPNRTFEEIGEAITSPLIGALMADEILHGWEGFDVEYSADVAKEILTNPNARELIAEIEYCAGTRGQIQVEFVEEASKNSGKPSAGSSKSAGKSEVSSQT